MIAGTWFDARPVAVAVPPLRVGQVDAVPSAGKSFVLLPRSAADDLIARYMDMRDDLNPIPRLAFIEDAARGADAAATADLLAQAKVDPDERVRVHAWELFDRATPVRRSSDGS